MSAVLVERRDGAAWLTLNRPDQGNAIDLALAEALAGAAADCAGDPAVRCVVLTGAGRLFCAGGDIAAFATAEEGAGAFLRELAETMHGAVRTLATMPKPLVNLINGPAAGGGLSLAALGDIVLADRSAHFTAAYTAIGLTPDCGMSWLLPRMVGLRTAQEIIVANRRLSADEAATCGLITRVAEDLAAEGEALVAGLVAAPTAAIGASRGLLLEGMGGFSDHLDREAETIAAAGDRAEADEGIAAFLARRSTDFRGT